jgi:hypothetical protein
MARIQYSNQVSDMRGKLNGSVHSRNKGGAYVRTKVTPINPATVHQATQRSFLQQIANAWPSILTDSQRASWTDYGKTAGAISVFGNGQILSGIAAFQGVNRIILAAGGTLVTNAPTTKAVTSINSATLTANHVGPVLSLAFTPTPLTAPEGLYVFATPAVSAGISNTSTSLRLIGFFSAATSPLNLLTAWQTRFGTFPSTAGQRIALTAEVVNLTTGAISASFPASTLVI